MSDLANEMEVRWYRQGIANAKYTPDYPFRSSEDGDHGIAIKELPSILDGDGIDRTPKPLFPIFLKDIVRKNEDSQDDSNTKSAVQENQAMETNAGFDDTETESDVMGDGSKKLEKLRTMTPELKETRLARVWAKSDKTYDEQRPWLQMMNLLLGSESFPSENVWDEEDSEHEKMTEELVAKAEVEEYDEDEVINKLLDKVGIGEREFSLWEEDPFVSLTESDKERVEKERLRRETENLKSQEAYSQEWELAIQMLKQEKIVVDVKETEASFVSKEQTFVTKSETTGKEQQQAAKPVKLPHLWEIKFARKNVILSATDTITLFDFPDFIVQPDNFDYRKVKERNAEYDEALKRYKWGRKRMIDNAVQTRKPKQKDEFVYTGPLQEFKDGEGLIDEQSLYETYVEGKIKEKVENPLIKRIQLTNFDAFLKFLEGHKEEFLPVLYSVEIAMNQNSYSELISACHKPSDLTISNKRKQSVLENEDPALKNLLSIASPIANGRHSVTCICFNFIYPYYFAAGFDATSTQHLAGETCSPGYVICWDIRHFQIPEVIFHTPEVVTCLEFSKETPYLLAAGMRNGFLAIFDISKTEDQPLIDNYLSADRPYGKIGSLRWSSSKRHEITCVSSEGKIYQWLPGAGTRANTLKGSGKSKAGTAASGSDPDVVSEVVLPYLCLDLKPEDPSICLVGTITGEIAQSTILGDNILSHNKHCGPVSEVRWSPIVKDIFLSCAFDSSVCLWDALKEEPCRTFYIRKQEPTINLDWSNTSSTFFGVVTPSMVTVFDLSLNKVGGLKTIRLIDNSETKFTCLTFFPYGNWFFVGRSDGIIDVYDAINVPTSHENAEEALRSAFLS